MPTELRQRLDLGKDSSPLVIVVGGGGVGKTTLAAAMGVASAESGVDNLVMTFDPSLRLKDALGVEKADGDEEIKVSGARGELYAGLLDAGATFDRLVTRHAPDPESRRRILENSYYRHLAGHLGGILEYMAVERLYEVAEEGRFSRIILDTPPTSQAIDFLEAPQRVSSFLDSGALKIALRPWFDGKGRLKVSKGMGFVGRGLEGFLDRVVGMELLRDMSEFFRAFEPLFGGFRERAEKVREMLASKEALFVLVTGPGEARIADTLFFARRLKEGGHRLGPIIVNRLHPHFEIEGAEWHGAGQNPYASGEELFGWLGRSHRQGFDELRRLLPDDQQLIGLPLEPDEPTSLQDLAKLGNRLSRMLLV